MSIQSNVKHAGQCPWGQGSKNTVRGHWRTEMEVNHLHHFQVKYLKKYKELFTDAKANFFKLNVSVIMHGYRIRDLSVTWRVLLCDLLHFLFCILCNLITAFDDVLRRQSHIVPGLGKLNYWRRIPRIMLDKPFTLIRIPKVTWENSCSVSLKEFSHVPLWGCSMKRGYWLHLYKWKNNNQRVG